MKSLLNKIMSKTIYQNNNASHANISIEGFGGGTIPLKMGSTSTITIAGSGSGGGGYVYNSNGSWAADVKSRAIHVNGDAIFEGNITWQNRDMREWFESVEARLALLRPNPDLEKEWSELAELRRQYVELERDILAKQQVFDILKKSY